MAKTGQNRAVSAQKASASRAHVRGSNPFYEASKESENGNQLTTKQISKMFAVTTMTIYNWRKSKKMPCNHLEGGEKPPVRFDEGAVMHWAESQGIPIASSDY